MSGMRLSLTSSLQQQPQLRQIAALKCSVCKQLYDQQRIRTSTEIKIVFGSAEYAICPCCQQGVSDATFKSKLYRERFDRFIQKRLNDHEWRRQQRKSLILSVLPETKKSEKK
jgi:hypothetical protein